MEEAESWNKKNESQNAESKSEDYKAEKEELLSTGHEPEDTHLMNEEGELLNKDQERNYTQFLNQEQQNEGSKELDEVSDEAEGLRQCQGSKEAEIMNEDQDSGKAGLLHKDRDIKKAELANKNEDNDHIKVLNEKEENIMVELLIKNQGCKQEELLSMEEKGVEAEFLSEELNNKEQGNQDTYCEEVEPLNEHRESVVKDSPNQNQDMRMTINLSGEMTHEKEIVMSVKQLVDNESSIQEESKQNKEEREILSRYHGAVQAGIMTMTQNNNVEGMVSKDEESGEAEILNQNQECVELKLLNEDKDNDITEILSKDQVREETDLLGCDMESQLLSKQQQGEKAKILNQCQKGEEVQLLYDDQYNKETMVLGKYNETVTAHMKITQDGNKAEMLSKDQTGEEAELLNQNKQNVEAHILNEGQNGNDLENLGQDRKKIDLLNKHIENELQVMHKESEEAEILNKCQDRDEAVIISLVQEGEEAEILDKDQDNGELEDQESEETERLQDEDDEEAEILDQENKEGDVTHKDQKREETALASKDIESEEAEILNDNQEYKEVESLNEDQDNEKADILKKHREGGEFEPLNTDKDREETEIEERYLPSEEAMIMQEDQEYLEVEMLNMDQDSEEVETLEKKLEREKVETLNEEQETMKEYIQHEDQNSSDSENLGKYLEREEADITPKDKQREETDLLSADTLSEETEILNKVQDNEEAETLIQGQQSEETAILIQDQESKEAEVMNTDQDSAEVHLLNKDWNSNEVQIQSNNKEGEEAEIMSCHQEGEDMEVLNKEQDGEEIMVPNRDLETEEVGQVQDFVQNELLNMGQMIEKVEIINQDQEGTEAEMLDWDQEYVGVELPCTLQYRYKTHLRDAFDKLREVGGSENECDPDTSRAAVEDNEWIWDCELLKEQQYYSGCNEKKESWDIWDETDEAELGPTAYKERRELGSQIDNVIYWQRWSEDEFGRNNETRQILANDLYPIAEENETENNLEYNNVQITQDIAKIQEMPQAADQSNTIIHFIKDNHELKEIQENKCILSEGECAEQRNIVKLMELRGKTEDLKTFGNNKEHQDVETIEGTTGNTMENRQCPATLANAVNQKDSNDLSECFILDGEKQEANAIKQSPDSVLVRSDVLGGGNTDSTWVPEIPNNDDETICTGMAIQRDSIVREMGAMRGRQAMAETAEGLKVIQNAGFQMDGDRIQMQGSCEKDRGDVIEHLQLSMESDTKWDGGTSQGWDTIAMEMEYEEKTQRQNNYEGAGSKKLSEVITQEVIEHSGGTAGQQKGDGKNWDTFEGGLAQGDIALKHSEEESLHTDRAVEDYSNDCPHEKWDKTPVFSQYRGFEELEQKISTDEEKLLAYQGDGLERKTECLDVGPAQGTIQAKETEVGQQKDKGSDLIESEEASTGFSEDSESLIEKLNCDMNVMELLAEQGEKDNERRDEACKDNNQLLTELVEYSKRGSDMKGVDDTSRSSNKQGVSLIQHVNSEDKEKEGVKKREQGTERHRMTPEEVCGEEELRMEAIRIYEEAEQEMSGDVMAEREAAAKEQKHREDKGKEGFRAMGGGIVVTPEDNRQRAIGCLPTGSWSPPISGPDLLYNIVLVGSSSVGKTSFMKRTQSGEFTLDHCATIGLDSCIQSLLVDGRRVLLQLWDTAGQERYHSITKQILRKAQGLLLMYDITCIDSFNSVQYWMSCIQEGATDDVIIMLLGNKNDSFKREVPLHEGERLAKEYRIKFMECSVATGENVTLSMETLARMLKQQTDQKEEAPLILRKEQPKQRSGCC